jgi:hypothetical protein
MIDAQKETHSSTTVFYRAERIMRGVMDILM